MICIRNIKLINQGKKDLFNFIQGFSISKIITLSQYCFSDNKNPHEDLDKMSFQQLMTMRSDESLKKAADQMAKLQLKSEELQQKILMFGQAIIQFPKHHKQLVQKIRTIQQNIKHQDQENKSIELRAQKQIQDTKKYAVSKIAKQIIQISDSLQRSFIHSQQACDQTLKQVQSCKTQLNTLFAKYGIEEFDPTGQKYNPNTQQSLLKIPIPKDSKNKSDTVAQTSRTGFKIKGRLLRSAHVCIYQ